ncbi:DoxX family membrane protein [Bradyrhizobium sp. RDT10]
MIAESGRTIIVPLLRPLFPHPHCSEIHQPAFVTFGRVLFAVLFICTGRQSCSAYSRPPISSRPNFQFRRRSRPTPRRLRARPECRTPQPLAVVVGALELITGLMIALNFGARFFVFVLVFYLGSRLAISTTSGISRHLATPRS